MDAARPSHKSTSDLFNESTADSVLSPGFLDAMSSTFVQPSTSGSFVFNSSAQKLINRGKNLEEIDEAAQPTYKGFSSFDDVNLSPPKQDEDDIVSETGILKFYIATKRDLGSWLKRIDFLDTVKIFTTGTLSSNNANFPPIGVSYSKSGSGTFDFADLGIPTLNTRNFGIGSLLKRFVSKTLLNRMRSHYC